MPSAFVRTVILRKWFPSDDLLAAKIARCCILREDMKIEFEMVQGDNVRQESDPDPYRNMYLYRNLFRTQMELSSAVLTLLRDRNFEELLKRQKASVRAKFLAMNQTVHKAHRHLKDVRNDICGHVKESAVKRALRTMPTESFGILDLGPRNKDTRYAFTSEIVAGILLKGVRKRERIKGTSKKFRSMADVLPLFSLVDYCFAMYAQDRGLKTAA